MFIEKIKSKVAKTADDWFSLEEKKTLDEYLHMPTGKLIETKKILDKQWENSKTYKRWMGRSVARVAQTLAITGLIASGYIHYSRGNAKQEFMDKINNGERVTRIEKMPVFASYASYPDYFKDRIADGEEVKPVRGKKFSVTYTPDSVAENGGPSEFSDNWFLFDKIAFGGSLVALLACFGEWLTFRNSKQYAEDTKVLNKSIAASAVLDMRQKERE